MAKQTIGVPGTRLPSSRTLAADLGGSRNTVELAFSQPEAEGFLTRHGVDDREVSRLAAAKGLDLPPLSR